jgi:hypothetical protein
MCSPFAETSTFQMELRSHVDYLFFRMPTYIYDQDELQVRTDDERIAYQSYVRPINDDVVGHGAARAGVPDS